MYRLLPLFLIFPFCANADTNWYQVAANTTLVADWLQTREIASYDYPDEENPILGERPSQAEVNRYFLASTVLTNVVGELLPKEYSDYFYLTVAVVETKVVLGNYAIGVRIKFWALKVKLWK